MIAYRVQTSGPLLNTRELAQRFDREITGEIAQLGALGQRLVIDRTPRGVSSGGGGLRGSVHLEFRGVPAQRSAVVGSALFYAPIVEEGRRPGRRPPARPGSALHLWVRRKLGVGGEAAARVTFLVARKVGRVGSPGAFMFQGAFQRLETIASSRFAALEARLAGILDGGR